jgi:hypothetical protein
LTPDGPSPTGAEQALLFKADPDSSMVGGQALATWADYYAVEPPDALSAGVTVDLDFLGNRAKAVAYSRRLTPLLPAYSVEVQTPEFGDATINAAIIRIRGPGHIEHPIRIDFVTSMCGYPEEELNRLVRRLVTLELEDVRIDVMHPIDCLRSRVHNYITLPAKRNEKGLAQVTLAMRVVRAFLVEQCGLDGGERAQALKAAREVVELACHQVGLRLWKTTGVDLISAVDPTTFQSQAFQNEYWPRALAAIQKRRAGFERASNGGRDPVMTGAHTSA